jgi:hypothetical protein
VDPVAGKLVQAGTGLTLSTIPAPSGATALTIASPAVHVPCGQAAPSPSAVPVPADQAATPSQEMLVLSLILPKNRCILRKKFHLKKRWILKKTSQKKISKKVLKKVLGKK